MHTLYHWLVNVSFHSHISYPFESALCIAAPARVSDSQLAETMIGKAVEHMFEQDEGPKEEWRGMVLARAPIMNTWFYITYEKDPVLYMYQLLDDYKEGDLRIMPDSSESPSEIIFSV